MRVRRRGNWDKFNLIGFKAEVLERIKKKQENLFKKIFRGAEVVCLYRNSGLFE